MASVKDTATFFAKGTSSQFEHVLNLYPEALKVKAERKTKKPEELIKLDNWYQNELPLKIKSRGKDAHLIHEELVQTMKWKLARGKFYPQLSYLVKVNTPKAVVTETKRAFRKLPNLEQAITALSNLKGVGTTMASALLAAAAPEKAPFMADECLMAIPEIEGIDYTTKEYLNFVNHIQSVVDRLNKEVSNGKWNPHSVELALWTHYVAAELKPSMLDSIPSPTENGDSHPEETKNGSTADKAENDNSDESLDRSEKHTTDNADSATEDGDSLHKFPAENVPPSEDTNDSVATSESTNDSTTNQSETKNDRTSPFTKSSEETNNEEPATKKIRVDE